MDGYISREALMDMLLEQQKKSNNFDAIGKIIDIRRIAAKIPTADVVEVRHGEWQSRYKKKYKYRCSLCNGDSDLCSDYCPNCGAKMDGKRKDGAE